MATIQQIADNVKACAVLVSSIQSAIVSLQALLSQGATTIPPTVQAQIDALSGYVDVHQTALTALETAVQALPKVSNHG